MKGYHECPFTERTGESFVLKKNKSSTEERHSSHYAEKRGKWPVLLLPYL